MNARLLFAGMLCASALAAYAGCTVKASKGGTTDTTGTTTGTMQQSTGAGSGGSKTTTSTMNVAAPTTVGAGGMSGAGGSTSTGGTVMNSCNPVTNAPCDSGKGQACDASFSMQSGFTGFKCYDPPNDAKLCGTCDGSKGPFCAGTLTCSVSANFGGKCMRYCCNDMDCGTGKCLTTSMNGDLFTGAPGVGVCTDAAMKASSCDAPAMAKSNGSCVKLN